MSHSPFRYVPGCSVEYRGATDRRGSQWVAVIRRGRNRGDCYRYAVPYALGPDLAARGALDKFNGAMGNDGPDRWELLGAALSMDGGDRYAYPVGPAHLAPVLPAVAPA